jgi:cytochrome c biogenesis protein CcdA
MKIFEIIAFVSGTPAFVIGLGMVVFYSIASYNQKHIETIPIVVGLGLIAIGWLLTRYAVKKKGWRIIHYLLELF